MLRGLLICADEKLRAEMPAALEGIPSFELIDTVAACPTADELQRIIASRKIGLLLAASDDPWVQALAEYLDKEMSGFPVITIGTDEDPELLMRLMRSGVREHLTAPVSREALAAAINAERERLRRQPHAAARFSELYTFLPARPGVGASTIALSASCAMAEEVGAKTLLLDCDLWAGSIRFLLGLHQGATLMDAMDRCADLDEEMWKQIVSRSGKLDVLHAGDLEPVAEPDPEALNAVLRLACAQYNIVCADLPSSLDRFTMELLKQSTKIFLVATPEVVVLHMAAARVRRLSEMGLGDRVHLVLNRRDSGSMSDKDLESLVGVPVAYSLSNDYGAVQGAIMDASAIANGSDLGQSIVNLARTLAPECEQKPQPAASKRKFLEFFHVARWNEDPVWRD